LRRDPIVIKKKEDKRKISKVTDDAANARRGMCPGSGRQETRLELPAGEPDLEALRSVTREWLVPRLVENFLCKQGVELRVSRTAAQCQRNTNSTKNSNTALVSRGRSESEHGLSTRRRNTRNTFTEGFGTKSKNTSE
jgi:hypothetical protein